jgi:outer membrane receptor for ferrienterochelin and colicins
VTRDGRGLGGTEAAASGASYDTYTGRLTFGRQFTNGLNLLLSGSFLDSVGQNDLRYPEYASIDGGRSHGLDEEQAHSFFASASWHDLTLEGAYGKRNREVPNAAYGTRFGVSPNEISDERAYVELRWERVLPKDWTLNARLFADHYLYQGTQPYDTDPPGGTVMNSDIGKAQYVGGELRASKTLFGRHRVTAGTEWRYTTTLQQDNRNDDPYEVFSDVDSDFHNVGVFLQDEYTIARPLSLHAGLRYDWFSTVGDTFNPRAALLFNPWEDTTLKLIYGEAFRAPNAFEFDYVAPGYAANQALQPETIRSYEVALEQGFARHYRASASLFLNQMNDLITQQEVPDPANPGQTLFTFRNTDEVEARGAELEVEADYGGGWRMRASYSYVEATDRATDDQLANSHTHLGRVNLIAPLYPGKIFAGLEVQAGSARTTLQGNRVGSFARCNLTLYSRQLLPGLEASASLYNLFDTSAADPVGADLSPIDSLPQEGRSFRFKLTYSF